MGVDDLLVQQPVVSSTGHINSIFTVDIYSKCIKVEGLFQHILLLIHEGLNFLGHPVLVLKLFKYQKMFTKLNLIRLQMIKSFTMQKVASRLDEVILLRNEHFKLHHFLSLSL